MRSLTEIAPGVLVGTSSYALTTTTVVVGSSGSGGCLLIDPAVTVAELAALAASLRALGLRPAAAWSTHPHWDHVLWDAELGDAPRYAAPAAVIAAETERNGILAGVQQDAPGHDLSLVGLLRPLDASTVPGTDRGLSWSCMTGTPPVTAPFSFPAPASWSRATCAPTSRSRCSTPWRRIRLATT